MKDPNKDARTLVSIINQMRVTGQTFNTVAELKSEYTKAGGKIIDPVISYLIKNNIIIKKDKKFVFADYSQPIHFAGIAQAIQENRQKQMSYYKKDENHVLEKINTHIEPVDDTQMLIDTLKSRGYKVLKPVVQYEEI